MASAHIMFKNMNRGKMNDLPEPNTKAKTFQEAMDELRKRYHPDTFTGPPNISKESWCEHPLLWILILIALVAMILAFWQPFSRY